jgi:hypothetical protein
LPGRRLLSPGPAIRVANDTLDKKFDRGPYFNSPAEKDHFDHPGTDQK